MGFIRPQWTLRVIWFWQGYSPNLYIHTKYNRLWSTDSFQDTYIHRNRIPEIQKQERGSLTLSRSNYLNGFPDFRNELDCKSPRRILRSSSHSSWVFAFAFNFWKFRSKGDISWRSGKLGSERYFVPLGGHSLASSFFRLRKSFETSRPFPVCTNCWLTSPLGADTWCLPVDCSASDILVCAYDGGCSAVSFEYPPGSLLLESWISWYDLYGGGSEGVIALGPFPMVALWAAKPQVSCAATRRAGVIEHDEDGAE